MRCGEAVPPWTSRFNSTTTQGTPAATQLQVQENNMSDTFGEALSELVVKHRDSGDDLEEIISEMELQMMALKEQLEEEEE